MNTIECCICGPVKNCSDFLPKVFENIEKIGSLFKDYKILIFYDKSSDGTLQKLRDYKNKNPTRLEFYVNKNPVSKFRTHNIAYGRNMCLEKIRENKDKYPFFIMMDFDDVNCKNINLSILPKYFDSSKYDWDALSFNTYPKYYDIWALSIYPYCFSYNHFDNNTNNGYYVIQNYIMNKLNNLKIKEDNVELLSCISSFNGFAIYKTSKFLHSYYDGRVRYDLLPKKLLLAHSNVAKSLLMFKDYGNVNGLYEDCEHRAFHNIAIQKTNAKIKISPEILFT